MVYSLIIVGVKFFYQLPIFCGTPAFSIWTMKDGCEAHVMDPAILVRRFDYIFGIYKFTGPASLPKDQGIFLGLIGDILIISCLLFHKGYLQASGQWHYVKITNDIYSCPSIRNKQELELEDQSPLIKKIGTFIKGYFKKLMPTYI